MTKKEALVKYISEMNIDMLSLVLANDISIMSISKNNFIEKLDEVFKELKAANINEFSKVITGVSEEEKTKHIEGYQFITSNKRGLTLLFKEISTDLVEIYTCTKFRTYQSCEYTEPIKICVWDDEKIDFTPTFEQISLINKIDSFYIQFKTFKNSTTLVEDFENWFKPVKELYNSIHIISNLEYKFYYDFSNFVVDNMFVEHIVENREITQKALQEYNNIATSNEFELLEWRLKYSNVRSVFSNQLKKVGDWEEKSQLYHKIDKSIILDCSNYKSVFIFEEIYSKLCEEEIEGGIKV